MNGILWYGISGLSFVVTFLVVHFTISRLLSDRLNIDFGSSLAIATVPLLLFYYGIPSVGSMLSFEFFALSILALWLTWKVSGLVTFLDHRQDVYVSLAACAAFVISCEGLWTLWTRLLLR